LRELSGLPVETIVEAGDIGTKGRYKGKPTAYGLGILAVKEFDSEVLNNFLGQLLTQKLILENTNVEEVVIDFDANTTGLSSFNFSAELLKKIYDLNARLELNNHKAEGKEEFSENLSEPISVQSDSFEKNPIAGEFWKKWRAAKGNEKKKLEIGMQNLLSL